MRSSRRRYAVVGTGARAEMFVRELVTAHSGEAELVALADPNPARMRAHNHWLTELGHPEVPAYPLPATGDVAGEVAGFVALLDKERVDVAIVTSVDATHDRYIVAALEAGRDVITEKPMTVDAARCTRILHAAATARQRGAGSVAVAFNYRYNPVHEKVRELLAGGAVGEIGSVHFEWLLDVRHGADYFRRWHRETANSGGLLVHKASHHFDLVNWWLGARPVRVYADNHRFFYGPDTAGARRYDRGYARADGAPGAADDPFALDLAASPRLRELYLDAEAEDGYLRDRNVFAAGVDIADDMSVLVRYDSGATMTYHLTAYAPWEGYRVMVNGSLGRLELSVVESGFVDPALARRVKGGPGAREAAAQEQGARETAARETAALHGVNAAAEAGGVRLTLHPFWRPSEAVELPGLVREGHGGGDARMTADLF
ncbi:MAG TPA: Gfo/Idh/MocA family oxidoreductase, partial [Rugosimonospora sp.]|nr:Gfo/Idh/MocA family oxidoreductase [Rugosimonospora sp.]